MHEGVREIPRPQLVLHQGQDIFAEIDMDVPPQALFPSLISPPSILHGACRRVIGQIFMLVSFDSGERYSTGENGARQNINSKILRSLQTQLLQPNHQSQTNAMAFWLRRHLGPQTRRLRGPKSQLHGLHIRHQRLSNRHLRRILSPGGNLTTPQRARDKRTRGD